MDDNNSTKHQLELPVKFSCRLVFTNHQRQFTEMEFTMPPGVYPNPDWLPTLIGECQREALKALKLQTKDLSWRKPSIREFIEYTTGKPASPAEFELGWVEPYTSQLDLGLDDEAGNDNDSN